MQPLGPTTPPMHPGLDPEWAAYHEKWPSMRSLGGESEPEVKALVTFHEKQGKEGSPKSFPS